MQKISLKAYAKINIGLDIISKRPDGYHEILTIFQQIDLHDKVELSSRDDEKIVINSDNKNVPLNQNNICYKAASLLREVVAKPSGINITIDKRIPIGAGLGGGSSDAASTLKGLIELWKISVDKNSLINLAKKIGADVPFFLKGGTAIASGIGEKLRQITFPKNYFCVLVYPNVEISTYWAYKNINFNLTKTKKISKLSQILQKKINLFELKNNIQNDFEDVIFEEFPELNDLKNKLYQHGAFFASMSGSGSTIYGLFKNFQKAEDAVRIFSESYQTILARPI